MFAIIAERNGRIPETIAFSIIAGVDPKVGLYASFCICVVTALVGSRPGMISGATGAMALLMVTLVREHGLEYLLAASFLAGVIQIAAGYLKLGNLMNFVSKSVITGFVNALAILIFMAQLPELIPGYRLGWVVNKRFNETIQKLQLISTLSGSAPIQQGVAHYLQNDSYDHLSTQYHAPYIVK